MNWTIAELIRRGAAYGAAQPAILFDRGNISYGALDAKSNQVGSGLILSKVAHGEHIALLDRNCPEQLEIMLGVSKAGAVFVPINWRLASSEIAYVLNDCEARILFVGAEFIDLVKAIRPDLKSVQEVFVIGEDEPLECYLSWRNRQEAQDPGRNVAQDDIALLLYTSGTTGLAKGVMLTSRNLFTLLNEVGRMWGLNENTRSIVCMPLFHIGGIGWALAALRFNGLVILVKTFVADEMLSLIEAERATHVNLVPSMLKSLLESPTAHSHDYGSLELILYGTAPIAKPVLIAALRMFSCSFVQVYGLTETTSAITQLDAADHHTTGEKEVYLRSAGRPYPWIEAKIVDPNTTTICAVGKPGELWVRSSQNMQGYWRNERETAKTVTDDGWLRTGDIGYVDQTGYLYLTDRAKDLIVSGGENIYPAECEKVLLEHSAVGDVAVIGVPDSKWGEAVKAVVVVRPGQAVSEQELIEYARQRLAHYKCPRSVDFVENFPRNATGKILKRMLREPHWQGRVRRIS
jgi:long-chain acyl-CoA synthetase